MAIRFTTKIGKMVVKQKHHDENGNLITKKYKVSIWEGNCLAVFNTEDKDKYYLYMFFADEKHCKNIVKNHGSLFGDEVTSIELNMYYKPIKLLNILTQNGYKVKAYYKEPKQKKSK